MSAALDGGKPIRAPSNGPYVVAESLGYPSGADRAVRVYISPWGLRPSPPLLAWLAGGGTTVVQPPTASCGDAIHSRCAAPMARAGSAPRVAYHRPMRQGADRGHGCAEPRHRRRDPGRGRRRHDDVHLPGGPFGGRLQRDTLHGGAGNDTLHGGPSSTAATTDFLYGDAGTKDVCGGPPPGLWTLIWTLMDPVSCVSCVSWMYWLIAAETHETFHWDSGMRYQLSSSGPISTQIGLLTCPAALLNAYAGSRSGRGGRRRKGLRICRLPAHAVPSGERAAGERHHASPTATMTTPRTTYIGWRGGFSAKPMIAIWTASQSSSATPTMTVSSGAMR